MSVSLTINGTTFDYPETSDQEWGPDSTDWAVAVTSGMLQKAGGLFQLLAETDFGSAFGVKSIYYKSRTANPASAGIVRLARADTIGWRNQANDNDLLLSVNSSDQLLFNGTSIGNFVTVTDTSSIDLTLASGDLSAVLLLSAAAATAGSFKATASIESDGLLVQAKIATTAETGFLSSTDWTTFNAKQAAGNYITALTGDVTASGPGSVAATIAAGVIVNSMVSATAAIAFSKLATLTSGNILVGSAGNVPTSVAMSGDITIANTGAAAIGSNKVTNAMLAQVATATFKGRTTSGTGNAEDLTATQATALLNQFVGDSGSGGTKGLVTVPAAGDSSKFLKGNGTWATPPGAGDVVGPGSSTDSGFAKFDGTTGKLLKNSAATIARSDIATATAYRILANDSGGAVSQNAALTAKTVIIADANGQLSGIAPSTSGKVLTSNGTDWASTALPLSTIVTFGAKTANYTVTSTDEFLTGDATSAAFTFTLPAASSVPGRVFYFKRIDQTLANLISITRAGSDTIDGNTTVKLGVLNEELAIASDGSATWRIIAHSWPNIWTAYTPTGLFTGGNVTYTGFWRKVGANMDCQIKAAFTGSPSGTGNVTMNLPTGVTIDTAQIVDASANQQLGGGQFLDSGGGNYCLFLTYNSTTSVRSFWNNVSGSDVRRTSQTDTAPNGLAGSDVLTYWFSAPITGWF